MSSHCARTNISGMRIELMPVLPMVFLTLATAACGGDVNVAGDQICETDSVKCVAESEVHKCNAAGTSFLFVTQCASLESCSGGECIAGAGQVGCTTGEKRCSPDRAAVQLCTGQRSWKLVEFCPNHDCIIDQWQCGS